MNTPTGAAPAQEPQDGVLSTSEVHLQLGTLTRQLHDSLTGLGLTDKVKDWAGELPDAKSRLSYIARLTGEAAEKVLNQVDQAKAQHDHITAQTRRMAELLQKDPHGVVANEQVMQFVAEIEQSSTKMDAHLTEIMMAQDFHDLTGQVIAKVVHLAATIEDQLLQLLLKTAPAQAPSEPVAQPQAYVPALAGPVVAGQANTNVVTAQSEVDDLLASLGF